MMEKTFEITIELIGGRRVQCFDMSESVMKEALAGLQTAISRHGSWTLHTTRDTDTFVKTTLINGAHVIDVEITETLKDKV